MQFNRPLCVGQGTLFSRRVKCCCHAMFGKTGSTCRFGSALRGVAVCLWHGGSWVGPEGSAGPVQQSCTSFLGMVGHGLGSFKFPLAEIGADRAWGRIMMARVAVGGRLPPHSVPHGDRSFVWQESAVRVPLVQSARTRRRWRDGRGLELSWLQEAKVYTSLAHCSVMVWGKSWHATAPGPRSRG